MIEQNTQNTNQIDNNKDDFGLLPWDCEPGFFARLLGYSIFSIDNENLLIHNKNNKIKLDYVDVESIECEGNNIHIKTSSNKEFNIKLTIINLII